MDGGPGQGAGRPVRNETPYLVPIVGDWPNRPGADPWNPTRHVLELPRRPRKLARGSGAAQCLAGPPRRLPGTQQLGGVRGHMDQDVHPDDIDGGGVRVGAPRGERHPRSLHLGRIRRCRSARRHDRSTGGLPMASSTRACRAPVRMPSPAGDYCYVFDMENREPLDTRRSAQPRRALRQRVVAPSPGHAGRFPAAPHIPCHPLIGGQPMTSPTDYNQHLLAYLQAWRQLLDASAAMASGLPAAHPRPCRQACRHAADATHAADGATRLECDPERARRPTTRSSCSATFRRGGSTSSRRSARRRAHPHADTRPADGRTDDSHGSRHWFPVDGRSQSTGSQQARSGDTRSQSSFGSIRAFARLAWAPKDPWGGTMRSTVPSGADFIDDAATRREALRGRRHSTSTVGTAFAEKMASVDSGPIDASRDSDRSTSVAPRTHSTVHALGEYCAGRPRPPSRRAPGDVEMVGGRREGLATRDSKTSPTAKEHPDIRPLRDLGGEGPVAPSTFLARGVRGRPPRVGGCRSCRCRRTSATGCATGPSAPPRSRAPRRS